VLDYQAQLDAWTDRANGRTHPPMRAVPAERLAVERERMRALPERLPKMDRRFVIRVPEQPYLRFDTNDYSLDPRVTGRSVEVRISQAELAAGCADTVSTRQRGQGAARLAERAREESWRYDASSRRCSGPRSPRTSATARDSDQGCPLPARRDAREV
jgi:hypothetical protein